MAGSAVTADGLPPPPARDRRGGQNRGDQQSFPGGGEHGGKKTMLSKSEQLMEAVRRGELTAVRRLVDKSGADVCTVNTYGLSCLQLAIIGGHTKLAEFIIQRGANIHSIDSQGWTALHDAAQMDMKGLVRKLVSKGCGVTATTDLGELPIDVAASVDMERTLCAQMALAGEEKLARDYEEYLGLGHVTDENRVIFPMSHRGPLPMCFTNSHAAAYARFSPLPNKMQLQRRHSSPVLPISLHRPTTTVGHQHHGPSKLKRTVAFIEEEEAEEKPRENRPEAATGNDLRHHTKLQEAVIDPPMHCSGHHLLHDTGRHHQYYRSSGSINAPRQPRPSSIVVASAGVAGGGRANPSGIRGSAANSNVRSLHRREKRAELGAFRSSATLSAALGVCFDSVATTFDGGDSPADEELSPDDPTSSTADSTRAGAGATDDFTNRTRKISFCEQSVYAAMARTKLGPSSVASAAKERAAGHLCDAERRELQELKGTGVGERVMDEPDADDHDIAVSRGIAIANLKRLPRKPSIIFPEQRRRSSADGVPAASGGGGASYRRRSVTFQPEVLLQEMVLDGDLLAVKKILDSGTLEDINKLSPAGLTALHQSAIDGHLECAKALVASGANINCTDCELWTPLHAAAMSGKIEVVRYLLSHGADMHLKNESQQTAYDVAKTGPIRKLLLCAMNGKSPDADEISDGEYSEEEEKEYSHMESESDDDGEEPCYFDSPKTSHEDSASPSPDFGEHAENVFVNGTGTKKLPTTTATDVVTSILGTMDTSRSNGHISEESGANDFASEDQGISTMDGSSDCSHRSRMLSEDEGTTRDVLDSDLVPGSLDYRFQEASLSCDMDTLLKLAKHRAEIDINRVNKSSGITALHHVVLEENFAMVQHLVKDFEADLHVKDRDGWTPLHAASAVGNIRIAQFLLENGAKASILNNQCEFPVDVAEDDTMEKLLKNVMLGPSVGNLLK
jgi:ankyrin repeat protein